MSKKLLSLLLILPALTFCAPKASENGSLKDIPEIHDADTVLATNVNVEKFLTEVSYPDTDYSFTKIFDYYGGYNESCTEEPDSDLPPVYCIRWNAEPGAGKLVFELKEPCAERTEILKRGSNCVSFTNLLPNTGYTFKVSSQKSGKVLTEGSFCTTGHLHQVWFKDNCRNARDLGGWTTTDVKTVKYRKIYRGGRMEKWTLSKLGGKEVLQEGIKAQLDLRGHSDVLSAPAVQGLEFCAPVIEQGGPTMLIDDAAKTKQCFDFILNCVKEDKPVYRAHLLCPQRLEHSIFRRQFDFCQRPHQMGLRAHCKLPSQPCGRRRQHRPGGTELPPLNRRKPGRYRLLPHPDADAVSKGACLPDLAEYRGVDDEHQPGPVQVTLAGSPLQDHHGVGAFHE